jgi:hypothetical protein
MTITPDQKAEWREARQQADAAIARLNDLFAVTSRTYRVRLHTYFIQAPGHDLDDLLADDLDAPASGIGSERAETEDEPEAGGDDEAEAESADEI